MAGRPLPDASTPRPDLGALLAESLGPSDVTAPSLGFDGPGRDAADAVTAAVLACRDGVHPDFHPRTRGPLATLVGGWRRADLPERAFVGALAALGDLAVEALASAPGDDSPQTRARTAAAILDATQILIRRSQRTFRSWRHRSAADDAFSMAVFGEALAHEIRNRIHAAHTALAVLRRDDGLGEDDRARLQELLKEAVVAARRAVLDVRLVTTEGAEPPVEVTAPLHELLRHTVERHRMVSVDAGITIVLEGTVPTVHVDARRMQVILNNMLDVGTRLLEAAGGTTLRLRADRPPDGRHVEITVEGDRGFLDPDHTTALLEATLVDPGETTDPARLRLWLAREAATSIGGDLLVVRDPARLHDVLITRLPSAQPRDPSS